ncbi:MAG: hypothetical protein IPI67_05990 [Myxococcales bacterium]|nr:hypothetical protein [Myxococcales bacterium]
MRWLPVTPAADVRADARRAAADAVPVPGEVLLHPLTLVSLALLLLNDHVFKARFPGFVTGKLSDVAGLVCFPLVLYAACELALGARPPGERARRWLAVGAVVVTGVAFAWIKLSPLGAEVFRVGLGLVQWPFVALLEVLRGRSLPGVHRVALARDAGDLLALPALLAPLWVVRLRRYASLAQ